MGQNGAVGGGKGKGEGPRRIPAGNPMEQEEGQSPFSLSASRKEERGPPLLSLHEERDFLRDFLGKETKEGEWGKWEINGVFVCSSSWR